MSQSVKQSLSRTRKTSPVDVLADVDVAYQKAQEVLLRCATENGLKASARKLGYNQVWARDSMITLLGAMLSPNSSISHAVEKSIVVLAEHQTPLGQIPNKVDLETFKSNFRAYADSGLWFIIGTRFYMESTRNRNLLEVAYASLKKTMQWYEYQNIDNSGLISMQEASDWEDLFATRGKGLLVNILYTFALKRMQIMAAMVGEKHIAEEMKIKSDHVRACIQDRLWYSPKKDIFEIVQDSFSTGSYKKGVDPLGRKLLLPKKSILRDNSYFLPYVTFRDFGEWFDSFGNLMAILTGVADEKQTKIILEFIEDNEMADPFPLKAIYPAIFPGDKDWKYYYRFGNLNQPCQYHNAGIWPFLGGFYVLALVKAGARKKAEEVLIRLAAANQAGMKESWEFNEWLHGITGRPMGMIEQAWSAGMYVSAYEAVKKGRSIFG